MIISFSVANFRSFRSEQTLSFRATHDKSHEASHCIRTHLRAAPRLVKPAVLLGPNASGKSNLLAALKVMRALVLDSQNFSRISLRERYTPFSSTNSKGKPTCFSIELLIGKLRYRYCIEYDGERIRREELRAHISHKSQLWFQRHFARGSEAESWSPFSPALKGARESWRKATSPQSLFLSTAARLGADTLHPLLDWFRQKLDVSLFEEPPEERVLASRMQNPHCKGQTLRLLKALDLSILDIRVSDKAMRVSSEPAGRSSQIEFLCAKEGMAQWINAIQYSTGAYHLVHILPRLLDALKYSHFVAIDEFDTHLHPMIARFLMQMLTLPTSQQLVQLLAVTHSTALLDLDIMRRDEIWLMSADVHGASKITRLIEHSPRRGEGIARAYLRGHYDAIPRFDQALLP